MSSFFSNSSKILYLSLFIGGYFIFHLFNPQTGYRALHMLHQQHSQLTEQYEEIKANRLSLEHKVNHLQPDSLDLDLCEELIKSNLGLTDPKEKIIFIPHE